MAQLKPLKGLFTRLVAHPNNKTKVRYTKSGVAKIQRSTYGRPSDWYSTVAEVKRRDNYCCVRCTKPENKKLGVFHDIHHIRPLSKGGTNSKVNLITLCDDCHSLQHKHMRQ